MAREQRTARLTVLTDPDKRAVFEALCAVDDVTPPHVVRRLIREFIEQRSGRAWNPGELEIEPVGQRDSDEYHRSVDGYLKQFESKLRSLSQQYPYYEP